jgi:predicted DNA-binding transcriptional regulator AlpA
MTHFRPYPPDWLDDDAAAYLLCLPVSSFREYVAAGALPRPVKIGRHSRWSREALNASLAEMSPSRKSQSPAQMAREFEDGKKAESRRHAA